MKRFISIFTVFALFICMQGCGFYNSTLTEEEFALLSGALNASTTPLSSNINELFSETDLNGSYDVQNYETIVLSDGNILSSDENVIIEGDTITIKKPNNYMVSGDLNDGQIIVDVYDPYSVSEIQLVLDNVNINSSSSPIFVQNADIVYITLADNSNNYLTSISEKGVTDACIYGADSITINGDGNLSLNSSQYGVYTMGTFKLTNGNLDIFSTHNGIFADKSIRIGGGNTTIVSNANPVFCQTYNSNIIVDGTFIAVGVNMIQNFNDSSTIGNVSKIFTSTQTDDLVIYDENNTEILRFPVNSEYTTALVASELLSIDSEYKLNDKD